MNNSDFPDLGILLLKMIGGIIIICLALYLLDNYKEYFSSPDDNSQLTTEKRSSH